MTAEVMFNKNQLRTTNNIGLRINSDVHFNHRQK